MRINTPLAVGVAAAFAFSVHASDQESPIPGLSYCAWNCTQVYAVALGCVSYLNESCVCTNTNFQAAAGACMYTSCTTDEIENAEAFRQAACS